MLFLDGVYTSGSNGLPMWFSQVSTKRLSLTRNGQIRYELKTPKRNGTTHVIFEPLDFISKLAALVPKPRVNMTRFHGVFAPNSKYHKQPQQNGVKVERPGHLMSGKPLVFYTTDSFNYSKC
jgi:hypothetical protein